MVLNKNIVGVRSRHLVCGQEKNGPKLSFLKNMNLFVKEFNSRTIENAGKVVSVKIVLFSDGSYKYNIKDVPVSKLLKEMAGEKKKLNSKQILEVAKKKINFLNTEDINNALKTVLGTIKNSNLKVTDLE